MLWHTGGKGVLYRHTSFMLRKQNIVIYNDHLHHTMMLTESFYNKVYCLFVILVYVSLVGLVNKSFSLAVTVIKEVE